MKVLVIGSTGRVGGLLVKKLIDQKYHVVTGSRHETTEFKDKNASHVKIDLTASLETITKAIPKDIDAIYFVSGSGGKNLLQVDLHGAIKTMQAAENAGINRYLMLSSVFALDPKRWNEEWLKDLTDFYIAKHYADNWLIKNTKLDYTILQPGLLEEKEGSGRIEVNVEKPGSNAIENVVDTLIESLKQDSTIGKVITMNDGDIPVIKALEDL